MGFKCGIIGLPNVGKSTIFSSLTKKQVNAENYPFCTIDPNVGVVPVPDIRLKRIAEIAQPKQITPAIMEFIDIAGLVKGASKGEGLGNQFLAHIRETTALAHIVRCFDDPNITHVSGNVNPQNDVEVINTELLLADLETIEKAINKTTKLTRQGDKQSIVDLQALQKMKNHLESGLLAKNYPHEIAGTILPQLNLLTIKPLFYVANIDENNYENNPYLDTLIKIAEKENTVVITICATIEAEIANFPENEKEEFLKELGMTEPGLNKLIRTGYRLLSLCNFFTAGPKEVRAWTIPIGTKAPKAAGTIHTDFEKGFIRAEVISYEDYIQCKGEINARNSGKIRVEGKDYIVQDGDIINFRFNV